MNADLFLRDSVIPTWKELGEIFPRELIVTMRDMKSPNDKGVRTFLAWLHARENETALELYKFLTGNRANWQEPGIATLMHDAIEKWTKLYRQPKSWKDNTVRYRRFVLLKMLERLSARAELRMPPISSKSFSFPMPEDEEPRPSLATLDWPEFETVPKTDWDSLALQLVHAHGKDVFDVEASVFIWGQDILSRGALPKCSDQAALTSLARLIEAEHRNWDKFGRSIFAEQYRSQLSGDISVLCRPRLFSDLGWPTKPYHLNGLGGLSTHSVKDYVRSCVGPNYQCAGAVQSIFVCSTGWNRQPIQQLFHEPYLYRTNKVVRLGSERAVVSFKRRAGHFVLGGDTNRVSKGIELEDFDAVWGEMAESGEFHLDEDLATVPANSDLVSVMSRYATMTERIRGWCDGDTKQRFFVATHSGYSGQVKGYEREFGGRQFPDGPITRKGTTFSAVRKSWIAVYDKSGATREETRIASGHHKSGSLERHYLTDPVSKEKRREAIRFQQECMQAITVDDEIALLIKLPEAQREWFANWAHWNGIASACGIGPIDDTDVEPDFIFRPIEEELLELYLAHRALKLAEREFYRERWVVQGHQLLARVLAIGRVLFAKGLRGDYKRAASKGRQLLSAGKVSLPPVMEV